MTTLRAFILERRSQINREIELLRAELLDLEKAEAALGEILVAPADDKRPATLKGMAIEVLRSHSMAGLTASQILDGIQKRFDLKIERSSLSPQLSRLKKEGILAQEGKNWRRVGTVDKEAIYLGPPNENEPSGHHPDGSEPRPTDGSQPSEGHVNKSGTDVFS